jgi:hypothetical protein
MAHAKKSRERQALLNRVRELAAEDFCERERPEQERTLKILEERNRRAIEELTNPEKNPRLQ